MSDAVHVYKVGGPALEDPDLVVPLAREVARLDGRAVLVHGGGGTAFDAWVRLWNDRGYAAIAMDLAGRGADRKRLPDGGPDQSHREKFNDIAGGRVPSGLLWILIGLKMPDVLGTILPLGIFVSVIWGLGRFYRDQEMAVMRASGFHWQMMLRPLFNLMLLIVASGLFLLL